MKKISVLTVMLLAALLSLSLFAACDNGNDAPTEYPVNTDNTEYGLWWYGPDGSEEGVVRASATLSKEYYDPSKPTVVYSHGWKPNGEDEPLSPVQASLILSKEGIDISGDSYAKQLKDAGFNVAYFKWNDYARWLTGNQNMIWLKSFDGSGNIVDAKAEIGDVSLAGEFAREFITSMQDYEGGAVYFIGHSFGAQMVTAAAYTLYNMQDMGLIANDSILPERLLLADPYLPGGSMGYSLTGTLDIVGTYLSGKNNAQMVAEALQFLGGKGVATDMYCAMAMAYKMYGNAPEIDEMLYANANYVVMDGLTSTYNSTGDVHNVARNWVLTAFIASVNGEWGDVYPDPSASAADSSEFGKYSMTGGFDFSKVKIAKA